jgi:hypothetical protein
MSTQSRGQELFAIRCSRSSKLVEFDEETFTDCWNEEVDVAGEAVEDGAVAGDGEWFYDTAKPYQRGFYWNNHANKWVMRRGGSCCRPPESSSLLVFCTVEKANAQAELVFAEMQRNHPFEDVAPSEPMGGRKRERAAKKAKVSTARAKGAKPGRLGGARAAEAPAAGGGSCDLSKEDTEKYKTMMPAGRAHLKREQRYYCDPFCTGDDYRLKNIVSSVFSVEVVPATLVS